MIRFALVLILSLSSVAVAQGDEERALVLFREGRVEFEEARFANARAKFEEALALVRRSSIAYNLARALRALGEPVEAEAMFQAMLAGEYGDVPEERARKAREQLVELSGEIASVRVRFSGRPTASLEIDGERVGEIGSRQVEHRLNQGTHRVVVVGEDGARAEEEITLAPGESTSVELTLDPVAQTREDDELEEPNRRWVWGLVLGLVGAAAAATAIGLTVGGNDAVRDPVFPTAQVPMDMM